MTGVHIHYNGLRIHITLEDLFTWFEVFEQASCNMPSEYIEEIDLDECTYHAVVDDRYMDILKEYDKFKRSSNSSVRGDIYNIHDFSYVEVKNKINNKQSSVGNYEQRNLGLPNEFDSAYDERKDGVYLIALYEMIKGWGYAQNGTPFENRYITANKTNDGKYYVHNAHRVAILKHLGYKKVKAYII